MKLSQHPTSSSLSRQGLTCPKCSQLIVINSSVPCMASPVDNWA
ncbi:hypothetical protein MtrunA17_Chr8g0343471 [Medicago truncatula]|uniref:Uncharacterized protein n=1 Tax=Medicago truncatula TaxID=3880 RepID=A0A396GD72_MEDTR|nr:hypothetical protein MtrunA17_Chr8g0343471 [Medicago truncatula]